MRLNVANVVIRLVVKNSKIRLRTKFFYLFFFYIGEIDEFECL